MLTIVSGQIKGFKSKSRYLNWVGLIIFIGLIALPRLLPFPATFTTYDETKIGAWVNEMAQGLLAGDWQATAITNNPYPAVTLAWLDAIQAETLPLLPGWTGQTQAQMLSTADADVFAALPRQRVTLAWLNTIIVLVIFWLVRRLYDNFVAVTAALLMAFDPFLLVESRVFRAEALTAGLMMLSALTVIYYTRRQQLRWLISSGVLAGLAVLTRVSALYLVLFSGLVLLAWPLLAGERCWPALARRIGRDGLIWGLTAVFVFVALWPALWSSPLEGPGKIYQALEPVFTKTGRVYTKGVFFQGHVMGDIDPGPSFYLWAGAYRTTPVLWLGLAAAGVSGVQWLLRRKKDPTTPETKAREARTQGDESSRLSASPIIASLFILAYVGFYFISINLSATKIDRYLVAMLPSLSILGALGFAQLLRLLPRPSLAQWGLWVAVLVGSALFSLPHHPYYYTYWNPLLGGGPAAVQILPATGRQGVDLMLESLNRLPNAANLKLSGTNLHLDLKLECPVIFVGRCLPASEFLTSDYFLLSLYEIQHRALLANLPQLIPDARIVQTYSKDGVDYAWLYKMPPGLQYVGHWLDLSAGSFSGYRLSATQLAAGDPLTVTLFWQNGEKSGWRFPDSELFVKLVDAAGQVQQIVPAQLKPEFAPYLSQPNEVLVFTTTFDLHDVPVGVYTLEMGLRLKATGQETINFSLTHLVHTITVNRGAPAAAGQHLAIQQRLEQPLGQTGLTLLGYDVADKPVEAAGANPAPLYYLYWQTTQPITQDYRLELALLDRRGQPVARWMRPLAPEVHPLKNWQPGEIVKLPFPVELGHKLDSDSYPLTLSVFEADQPASEPLAVVKLGFVAETFNPVPPEHGAHHLAGVTFGQGLDLLGYDLKGQTSGDSAAGNLLVTLYWLNRQPGQPVEAQIQVLDQQGRVVGQQNLPVPAPAHPLTWQSAGYYEIPLETMPASLIIQARPVGATEWYSVVQGRSQPNKMLQLDNILGQIAVVP